MENVRERKIREGKEWAREICSDETGRGRNLEDEKGRQVVKER